MSLSVAVDSVSPEDFAGNLLRQSCYAYFGDIPKDELEQWGIWYFRCRDSGLLDESNADVILKEFQPHLDSGDAIIQRDNHWAVGWVEGLLIRVYKPGTSEVTAAFQTMADLRERMDGYPVLDESDWSNREYDATLENVAEAGRRFLNGTEPEGWAGKCFSWFWENDQRAVECHDDGGGYPDDEQMKACLLDLGWLDEDYWPDDYVPPALRPNWEREPKDLPGQLPLY